MREIIFRGISKETKKLVFGYLIEKYGELYISYHLFAEKSCKSIYIESKILINTVGQLTGLKDKNGFYIYEGDIIKTTRNDWGIIVYKAPFFEVTVSATQSCMYSREWFDEIEIIGNIHENPELLK